MDKLVNIFDKIVRLFIVVLFSGLLCVGCLQIISRFFFKLPIVWADETMKYIFIWLMMVSAGYAVRLKKHVAADVVISNANPTVKFILGVIIDALSVYLCVMFVYLAPRMISLTMGTISPTLNIPMGYIYCGMFVGPAIMLFYMLIGIYEKYVIKRTLGGNLEC